MCVGHRHLLRTYASCSCVLLSKLFWFYCTTICIKGNPGQFGLSNPGTQPVQIGQTPLKPILARTWPCSSEK